MLKMEKKMNKYRIEFVEGFNFFDVFTDELQLKEELRNFYLKHKDSDDYTNFKVFLNNEDISETQLIQDIAEEILEEILENE
jgi:hypothetical protein